LVELSPAIQKRSFQKLFSIKLHGSKSRLSSSPWFRLCFRLSAKDESMYSFQSHHRTTSKGICHTSLYPLFVARLQFFLVHCRSIQFFSLISHRFNTSSFDSGYTVFSTSES
jgi:hypothetical protein